MPDRGGLRTALLFGACLWLVPAAGCSTVARRKLLNMLFDGASTTPNPPTRRIRRDLAGAVEELKRQVAEARADTERLRIEHANRPADAEAVALPVEQAGRWEEAAAMLPKDAAGAVDWGAAIATGAIMPRVTINPRAAAPPAFDLGVEVDTSGSRTFRAAFSHGTHVQWLGCQSCHPQLFPLRGTAARPPITMAAMARRQSCGLCHGTVAFRPANACSRCHPGVPAKTGWAPVEAPRAPIETLHRWEEAQLMLPAGDGSPEWTKALVAGTIQPRADLTPATSALGVFAADVAWVPEAEEDLRAVFPHSAHTAWLTCESCHPQPFPMKAGATPMSMEAINAGEFCGRCHGTVSFPLGACARCHPAMEAGP